MSARDRRPVIALLRLTDPHEDADKLAYAAGGRDRAIAWLRKVLDVLEGRTW